jgi:hypothetical protein
MPRYKLTEKGIQEARKKRTVAKTIGEAVTFGGPWKGEEYSNVLLLTLLSEPHKARDAHELTVETFNRPRPSEVNVSQTLSNLAKKGLIKAEPQFGHSGFSDKSGGRLSRRHHRGFKRVRFT